MKKWIVILLSLFAIILALGSCGKSYITVEYIADDTVFKTVDLNENGALERLNETPEKEGYFFGGWYYDNGTWERPFDVGEFNYNTTNSIWKGGNYKVYAKWEVVELTLSSDSRSYIVTELLAGAGENVVIPSHHENLPVATIGDSVFRGKTNLKSVTIPDTVKYIGDYAFAECTALTSLVMPHSIAETGTGAFEGCTALSEVRFSERLEKLGARTFAGCTALEDLSLPQSLKTIGGSAFYGCTGIETIVIPKYVEMIGPRAFAGCTGLTAIAIPDHVAEIEEYAFEACSNLASVTFGAKSSLMNLCKGAFSGTAITELTLPAKLAVLRDGAFSGMTALQRLTFAGADFIGNDIMEGTSVTTLYFSGTVEQFDAMNKAAAWYRNTNGDLVSVVCNDETIVIKTEE